MFLLFITVCGGKNLQNRSQGEGSPDLGVITRIRYEGFRNSKITDLASGLMDGIGPRLTGSPNMMRANEWTRDQLASFGLSNAHLEPGDPSAAAGHRNM